MSLIKFSFSVLVLTIIQISRAFSINNPISQVIANRQGRFLGVLGYLSGLKYSQPVYYHRPWKARFEIESQISSYPYPGVIAINPPINIPPFSDSKDETRLAQISQLYRLFSMGSLKKLQSHGRQTIKKPESENSTDSDATRQNDDNEIDSILNSINEDEEEQQITNITSTNNSSIKPTEEEIEKETAEADANDFVTVATTDSSVTEKITTTISFSPTPTSYVYNTNRDPNNDFIYITTNSLPSLNQNPNGFIPSVQDPILF